MRSVEKIQGVLDDHDGDVKDTRDALKELSPVVKDLQTYGTFGRHRGLATAVQRSVYTAIESVLANESLAMPADEQDVSKGGDPVRQAIYLESISMPTVPVAGSAIFQPLAQPRTVEVKVRLTEQVANNDLRARQAYDVFRQALEAVEVPADIWAVIGNGRPVPKLFAKVEEDTLQSSRDNWVYTDANRVDPLSGQVRAVRENRIRPVQEATFKCTIIAGEGAAE